MKNLFSKFTRRTWFILAGLLSLLGLGFIFLSQYRSYTLVIDGKPLWLKTVAFSSGHLLRQAGYSVQPQDEVVPASNKFDLNLPATIVVNRARPVQIITPTQSFDLLTPERLPANLIAQTGLSLFPGDEILWNGAVLDPLTPLETGRALILQFKPAKRIDIQDQNGTASLFTQAQTLGEALADANFYLDPADSLSLPLDTFLQPINSLSIERAQSVQVTIGAKKISGRTSARTVAEALLDLGIPLQGLDYSRPLSTEPVPADGKIELVRVQEEIILQKEETAYANTWTDDPNTELDHTSVVEPGQVGLTVTRTRARFENGSETFHLIEGPWKASDPIDGVLGYGTKVVTSTETINGDTIEYWRKVSVYATSYKPSSQGGGTGTASGIPLTKGIVAVTLAWYRGMKFQQVYIPGYGFGTIADTGGGIDGRYWIDLGYDDSNYESWHFWTTMYFLTPVPAYIPTILP